MGWVSTGPPSLALPARVVAVDLQTPATFALEAAPNGFPVPLGRAAGPRPPPVSPVAPSGRARAKRERDTDHVHESWAPSGGLSIQHPGRPGAAAAAGQRRRGRDLWQQRRGWWRGRFEPRRRPAAQVEYVQCQPMANSLSAELRDRVRAQDRLVATGESAGSPPWWQARRRPRRNRAPA